ncbi:hypothetical protein ABK040_005813 [Willaertia magna]
MSFFSFQKKTDNKKKNEIAITSDHNLLPTLENLSKIQPTGCDSIEYPSGDMYDGEINLYKQRHGAGVCKYSTEFTEREVPSASLKQPMIYSFTGKFFNGNPCIDTQAVIQYENGDRYCGTVMGYDDDLLNDNSLLSEFYHRSYPHRTLFGGSNTSSPSSTSPTNNSSNNNNYLSPNNNNSLTPPNSSKKKKSGFAFKSTASTDVSESLGVKNVLECIPFIMKHGEGELHYSDGSKYTGSFVADAREGYGVMVDLKNSTEYYGNWKDNEKDGFGVLIFKDGTVYEGEFKDGKQGGKGTLKLPTGDKIEGFWIGNAVRGTFEKGTLQNVQNKCPIMLLREEMKKTEKNDRMTTFQHGGTTVLTKEELLTQKKWDGLFNLFLDGIKCEKLHFENSSAYKFIEQKKDGSVSPISKKSIQDSLQTYLEDAITPKVQANNNNNLLDTSTLPFIGALTTEMNDNVLSRIISKFVNIFTWKYHYSDIKTTGTAKYLIPHALDDFHSFVLYLYEVTSNIIGKDAVGIFGPRRLIYILKDNVLGKIYTTLFAIYKCCYQEQDNLYKFKMMALSNITMRELGVKPSFIPENKDLFRNPYEECIQKLRKVSTQFVTAHEKYDLLVQVGIELISAIDFIEERKTSKLTDRGADDVLPVYLYVFIQAQIPHVYSTFKFLLDFIDEQVNNSEMGYRFSSFENAIQYIPMIDASIRDTNGILVPTFVLEERLGTCVTKIKKEAKERGESPRLLWISSIFIVVGSSITELLQNNMQSNSLSNTDVTTTIPLTSTNAAPSVTLYDRHHLELLRKYFEYAERILQCVSLKLEVTEVEMDTLPSNRPSLDDLDDDWTPLQRKKLNVEDNSNKVYRVIIEQTYPSHIYFKMASKLEEFIEEL